MGAPLNACFNVIDVEAIDSISRTSSTPLAFTHPIAPPARNPAELVTIGIVAVPPVNVVPVPSVSPPYVALRSRPSAPCTAAIPDAAAVPVGARLSVNWSVADRLPSTSSRYSTRDCTDCIGSSESSVSVIVPVPSRIGTSV